MKIQAIEKSITKEYLQHCYTYKDGMLFRRNHVYKTANGKIGDRVGSPTMKVPQTSHDAFRNLQPGKMEQEYQAIERALAQLGSANYEALAVKAGINKTEVGRRLSEMVKAKRILLTGTRSKVSSGNKAQDYTLPLSKTIKTDKQEFEALTLPEDRTAENKAQLAIW